ncbi:hypothetical protein HFP89_14930 [Wenzhouxiangella sp. XN79A]|uniref:hypothetical protein n=1 Tax=Wenzhouxiangella sp. XN79A TaxID=2724193 RepID=UPI00144A7233|nr:hypothetical protein [Wenzhouxiangella sp. XN79A]NKI36462.1 hypothetical protein [Wenzhouxiangella sp. XN79A]
MQISAGTPATERDDLGHNLNAPCRTNDGEIAGHQLSAFLDSLRRSSQYQSPIGHLEWEKGGQVLFLASTLEMQETRPEPKSLSIGRKSPVIGQDLKRKLMMILRRKAGMLNESEIADAQIAPHILLADRPHPVRQKTLLGIRGFSDVAWVGGGHPL